MLKSNFIVVEPLNGNDYNNIENDFIISKSIENVSRINRVGVVKYSPDFINLRVGDHVILHHNIFRKKYNFNGDIIPSKFYIKDNLYFVPPTEIFKVVGSEECFNPHCFVKPVKRVSDNVDLKNNEYNSYHGKYSKNIGYIIYSNKELRKKGINNGDFVIFDNNSEYLIPTEDGDLFKMKSDDILMKLN